MERRFGFATTGDHLTTIKKQGLEFYCTVGDGERPAGCLRALAAVVSEYKV